MQGSDDESESSSDEADVVDDLVQLNDDDRQNFFSAAEVGMKPLGTDYEYVRTLPDQYDEDSPNNFMRHVITDYALEKKKDDGKPSGEFVMDKKNTLALAKE